MGFAYMTSISAKSVRTTRITHVSEKLPNLEGAEIRKSRDIIVNLIKYLQNRENDLSDGSVTSFRTS